MKPSPDSLLGYSAPGGVLPQFNLSTLINNLFANLYNYLKHNLSFHGLSDFEKLSYHSKNNTKASGIGFFFGTTGLLIEQWPDHRAPASDKHGSADAACRWPPPQAETLRRVGRRSAGRSGVGSGASITRNGVSRVSRNTAYDGIHWVLR
jgi:hypothetical protein